MKYYVSLLVIFIGILGLGFFIINSLTHNTDKISENIDKASQAINDENWNQANKELDLVKEKWNQHKKWWAIIVDHQEIDNIDVSLARTCEYLNHQDPTLTAGELAALKQYLKHIPEIEKISWKNIF